MCLADKCARFISSRFLVYLQLDFVLHEVRNDLLRDLFQNLFGESLLATVPVVIKLDELDDVSSGWPALRVPEDDIISVELDHLFEVAVAKPNDDDAQRELAALHNDVLGKRHVVNVAVSQNDKDVVHPLVHGCFDVVDDRPQAGAEVRRPVQPSLVQRVLVRVEDPLHPVDLRQLLPVQVEAVRDCVHSHVSRDPAEAVRKVLMVVAVRLQDSPDLPDCSLVVVRQSLRAYKMQ